MTAKSIASVALSFASAGAQAVGLSFSSSAMIAVAHKQPVHDGAAVTGGVCGMLAVAFALAAVVFAGLSWRNESRVVRLPVLCLALAASIWAFVVV